MSAVSPVSGNLPLGCCCALLCPSRSIHRPGGHLDRYLWCLLPTAVLQPLYRDSVAKLPLLCCSAALLLCCCSHATAICFHSLASPASAAGAMTRCYYVHGCKEPLPSCSLFSKIAFHPLRTGFILCQAWAHVPTPEDQNAKTGGPRFGYHLRLVRTSTGMDACVQEEQTRSRSSSTVLKLYSNFHLLDYCTCSLMS